MRTTLRVDDDLIRELKTRADQEQLSLTRMINRMLRLGLEAARETRQSPRRYREKPLRMGQPKVDLTKALAVAGQLEDEETVEKMNRRK